ncbi:hypothetical protein CWB76_10850 [Pseudoalteromonas sp. S1609]|uniref:RES domain-containing protein n=1 Tax=Pseudoalteromonas sp. S1609 TaxID=579505 RepID=UPI00110AAC8C|nr:RES domain-containing protein [Pseudoalteromonas sp. S1609]TMP70437.1 hypothetical protein CWB76_10850 [Pseudoalteromonas sp. S1609]
MKNKKIKLKQLKSSYNVLASDMFYKAILDMLLEGAQTTNLRYTERDTTKFTKIAKILFGEKYQSDYFKVSTFPANNRIYLPGGIFYRSRKVNSDKVDYLYDDFWEAPPQYVTKGRLNKQKESMLYLAAKTPETAIKESRVCIGDTYILMLYKAVSEIEVGEIGWDFNNEAVAFMSTHFKKCGDVAYNISERLAKEVYQFENDGWSYPSVIHESGENICLNLEAKAKLELVGAFLLEQGMEEPQKLAIFDITNKNKIKILNDWDSPNSNARKLNESFDLLIEKARKENEALLSTYAKANNQHTTYKAVILPTE